MAVYSVHNRPGDSPDKAVFVPEGFSLGAAVFGVLWALWHRMWLAAAILFFIPVAIAAAAHALGQGETLATFTGLAVNLIFGFEARALWARSLAFRGLEDVGLVKAGNLDEAELRYFSEEGVLRPQTTEPDRVPPRRFDHDTLGLFGNA
jgi:hypothetical protein